MIDERLLTSLKDEHSPLGQLLSAKTYFNGWNAFWFAAGVCVGVAIVFGGIVYLSFGEGW